jgi:tetratricopeptide (TPR) repeat protein
VKRGRWLSTGYGFAVTPLIAVVAMAGCAPVRGAAYEQAFASASRAEGAGRFAEAARDYDEAARASLRPRDRDEAAWDAAQALLRAGRVGAALDRLGAIAGDPDSEHEAEAAFRIAVLRIEKGDADRGWSDLEDVARRYPTHGVAHVAVRKLVEHADDQGPQAAMDVLKALDNELGATELAGLVAYLTAQHIEAAGDDEAARAAYIRIADRWPYPFGAFFDDALWNASLVDEKLGRFPDAIADLERLVRERETTFLVGSYERAKYVPAMMRLGELYRDRLHDHSKAREAFHRLYAEFAHSTMRDDALWQEAALWREDGDSRTACDRLTTLVQSFPDSRYVPCAMAQCEGLTRPAGSDAPRECHAYITANATNAKM